jgi:DICT domain-containing protein
MESRAAATADVGSVLDGVGLRAVFQPIVDLDDDCRIVGYDVLPAGSATRVASKGHLLAMSSHIEQLARGSRTPAVLTGTFQHRRHFTLATAQRYLEVARHCSLVRIVAEGLESTPVAGVDGRSVAADHPVTQQWVVATLGAHEGAALIARDLGDTGADLDRRFEYVITHERDTVIRTTRSMLAL